MKESPISFEAPTFPDHLDIDLSTKCNLRCRFCHLSYYTPKEWTQISMTQFERMRPLLRHLKSITLFSKYEVLTARDFIPIFGAISEYDIESYFSTNGVLLTDDVIEAIVGKLTYLTVSVTGYTRESYIKNMGQDRLETVCQNLRKLNAAKAAHKTQFPKLRISTVGMLDTMHELRNAVDFAKEYQASEGVQLTYLKAHGKDMVELMPLQAPAEFQAAAADATRYAEQLGIPLEQQGGTIDQIREETQELGHKWCDMPWHRLSLQPNGDVYACPLAYQTVGNWFESSLEEIWNGEKLAKFRAGVNDPEHMNEDCRKCSHCRHRDVLDPAVNDFSDEQTYVGGMTRKQNQVRLRTVS